jgi:hypothetical protein
MKIFYNRQTLNFPEFESLDEKLKNFIIENVDRLVEFYGAERDIHRTDGGWFVLLENEEDVKNAKKEIEASEEGELEFCHDFNASFCNHILNNETCVTYIYPKQ